MTAYTSAGPMCWFSVKRLDCAIAKAEQEALAQEEDAAVAEVRARYAVEAAGEAAA